MNRLRHILIGLILGTLGIQGDPVPREIRSFINEYCLKCHGGDKVKGEVDFSLFKTNEDLDTHYRIWETAAELLREKDMPPESSKQPTSQETQIVLDWYQERFEQAVQAHPGYFRPRRLSAEEYRNTLRSLFGFDLEVQIMEAEQTVAERSLILKLMPTDPPGKSGFTNDTHRNPISTLIWDRYDYLTDLALERWFNEKDWAADISENENKNPSLSEARKTLAEFLPRIIRRPLVENELLMHLENLRASENSPGQALKQELKAVLMSPAFLYRGILMPRQPGKQQPVDAFEYAERMSYFLWGDMPDETLNNRAFDGSLLNEPILSQQLDRMLHSPKSRYLVESFAWQWFSLGDMDEAILQVPVREALRSQVMDFIHYLFTEDRPLMELIDSDISFINPLIAKHYGEDRSQLKPYTKQKGIELEIVPTQRIRLLHTAERGGILTMPGILAMNRGPVIRGTWILDRILGDHLPDPPMNVGQVPPQQPGENLSFRERFESHRNQASCALCHDKIDPLGFALEGYDRQGGYILTGTKTLPGGEVKHVNKAGDVVDTSGMMPNGTRFDSFASLKTILKTEYRTNVIQNIVERTLSFALGRSLELYDRPAVDSIVTKLEETDGTYRDLLLCILQSLPFRETFVRGESL